MLNLNELLNKSVKTERSYGEGSGPGGHNGVENQRHRGGQGTVKSYNAKGGDQRSYYDDHKE